MVPLGVKAMNHHIRTGTRFLVLVSGLWTATAVFPQTVLAQEVDAVATSDLEVLARGPVHEAFAEPVVFDPTAGLIVAKKPPQEIEEVPTDQKPEGDNVAWVSGYWGWDDDRDDFIWISGFWRVLPPGRQWVPGYWNETTGGYQFVSGFWASNEVDEIQYLPPPPATLEVGPSIPAPSSDYVWNPGCWHWTQTRYAWQPGFWMQPNPNWVWVPSSYAWSPRGYVFVNGFWDYALARRGLLYAPVYFRPGYYGRVGYSYRPNYAIDIALLTTQLFVRPNYRHYCFGDYYAPNYFQRGIYPWFAFHSGRYGYDPIWVHHRHHHGQDWDDRIRHEYAHRRDNRDARPSRTVEISTTSRRAFDEKSAVKPFEQVASKIEADLPLERVDPERRKDFSKWAKQTRDFARERGSIERTAARPGREGSEKTRDNLATAKLKLPKPVFVNPGNPDDTAQKSATDRKLDARDDRTKSKTADERPINTRPEKDTTTPPSPDAKKSDDKKSDTQSDSKKSDTNQNRMRPTYQSPTFRKRMFKKSDDKKGDAKSDRDRTPGTRGKRGRDSVPPPVPRAPTDSPKSDKKATPGDQDQGTKKSVPRIDSPTPDRKGGRPRVTPPEAPKSTIPKADTPKSDVPKPDAPKAPKAEVPKAPKAPKADKADKENPPKAEVPKASPPKAEVPKADKENPPKSETPKSETPKSATPKSENRKPNAPKADKQEAPGKRNEDWKIVVPRETRVPETRGAPRLPTASSNVPKSDPTTGSRNPVSDPLPRIDTRGPGNRNSSVEPRVTTGRPAIPSATPNVPKKDAPVMRTESRAPKENPPAARPRTENGRGNSAASNRSERAPAASPRVAPTTPRVSGGNAASASTASSARSSSGRSSSGRSTEARGGSNNNNRDKNKKKPE